MPRQADRNAFDMGSFDSVAAFAASPLGMTVHGVHGNVLVYDALLFFFRRDREILERRRIHRDRNPDHPFLGRRENIPPTLVRDEIHEIHLVIDFELQSGLPYPWSHTTGGRHWRPR